MLPSLYKQFGEGTFLFQHDCALEHKASSIKTWLDEFDVEELDLTVTSQILSWKNGQKFPQKHSTILLKAFPEEWKLL